MLVSLGVVTAVLGAWMCSLQRHVKRLLAFSTISHVGVFVCGIGLLSAKALAGLSVYIVGHGLTKAALFMCAGVLLHRFATIDEFDLHGRGREVPFVGVLFAAGGLLLAAAPPFRSFAGKSLLESASSDAGYGWLIAVFVLVSAMTGGAVLRVTGRVFGGWGPAEGPDPSQARAAEERVDEERGPREYTPPLMIAVPDMLLAAAAVLGLIPDAVPAAERAAARFTDHAACARWVLGGGHVAWPHVTTSHVDALEIGSALLAVRGALGAAALGLFGRPLREWLPGAVNRPVRELVRHLRYLHSGHIGDYIAWWSAGASLLGGVCLLALR
jgi:multicomponent Na+:H+ antiporter subunit D